MRSRRSGNPRTSANPSTLASEIEAQIGPINEPHPADEEANPILIEINEHARYVFPIHSRGVGRSEGFMPSPKVVRGPTRRPQGNLFP